MADGPSPLPVSPWQAARGGGSSASPIARSQEGGRRGGAAEQEQAAGPLLLDELLPATEVAVAHGAVHVDHALLETLEELEVQRAVVDGVTDLHPEAVPDERQHVAQRIHRAVHGLADPVTDGQRPAPHTAGVWPKSSRLFSMPQYLAASNRPPMPRVLLMRKRESSRPAPPHLAWSRLFTNRGTKRMLSKPFAITIWNGSGMTTL